MRIACHQSVDPAISIHVRESDDQARKNIRLHSHPHELNQLTQAMLKTAWQLPRSSSNWKVPMPRWVSQRTNKASHVGSGGLWSMNLVDFSNMELILKVWSINFLFWVQKKSLFRQNPGAIWARKYLGHGCSFFPPLWRNRIWLIPRWFCRYLAGIQWGYNQ